MIWIELIGPSGVGKSYWYEKFIKQYPEFDPKQLVLNRIYKSNVFDTLPMKTKSMFWIYRMNIYRISNHFKHKLVSRFLTSFQRKSKSIFPQEDNVIIKKYLKNIDCLNEPQIVVLKNISYFNDKLTEFKFYQFYLEEDDVYLAEDGLLHLSPIFIPEFEVDKILIFEKDFQSLLKQRLQRAKNKPTTFIEYLLEEEDLKTYVQEYYHFYNMKIKDINNNTPSAKVKTLHLEQESILEEMYKWLSSSKLIYPKT